MRSRGSLPLPGEHGDTAQLVGAGVSEPAACTSELTFSWPSFSSQKENTGCKATPAAVFKCQRVHLTFRS